MAASTATNASGSWRKMANSSDRYRQIRRQVLVAGPGNFDMARVLLIDLGQPYLSSIVRALQQRHHRIIPARPDRALFETLSFTSGEFDLILIDLTRNTQAEWALLEQIRMITTTNRSYAEILSFSSVNRGPEMRLRAERLGVRFIYV
jgi:hypothetical protein